MIDFTDPSGIVVVAAREIPEQPYGSRIRHEGEKNASAISMRILQTPW